MEKNTGYLLLDKKEFDNSIVKNRGISELTEEYIGCLHNEIVSSNEVEEVLGEYNLLDAYDVVVFGANVPYGEAGLVEILYSFDMEIFGFVFKRELMINTGCFNEKLGSMTNYEFLCRLSERTKIFFVNCQSENEEVIINCKTFAYVCRKYLKKIDEKTSNLVLSNVLENMEQKGLKEEFLKELNVFLINNNEFNEITCNTAPVMVISGNELCYGILNLFAKSMTEALIQCGQAVITTDGKYGLNADDLKFGRNILKAIVGFQAVTLEKDFVRKMPWKKVEFLLDNPLFMNGYFENLGDDYYVMCQDGYYAEDLKKYKKVKNAFHFPPGGDLPQNIDQEKIYDIAFMGTYVNVNLGEMDEFQKRFYDFMIMNPNYRYTEGLRKFLQLNEIQVDNDKFVEIMYSLKFVCRMVTTYYRKKVIDTLLDGGFEVHVYGESWRDYDRCEAPNLIIHPEVSSKEAVDEYGKAKIQLNVMSWHKAGMTERIANIMLSGAVCLSDETTYLCENFVDGEEIVLFSLGKLDELNAKVKELLDNEELRKSITNEAYIKAAREHTWKKRAEELLKILNC